MNRKELVDALAGRFPSKIAEDLVDQFLQIRQDVATRTLGRSAPGKFAETFVEALQYIETGKFEDRPDVDSYLKAIESRSSSLHDGLRICAARVARAMYTLRNKRNIAHKGEVDPNEQDLGMLHGMAQWIMAELIRTVTGLPMEQAGRLVAQVEVPIGGLVEDFGGRRLVLEDLSAPNEVLVILHSHYPNSLSAADVVASLDRHKEAAVHVALKRLWKRKLIEGDRAQGYKLTQRGFREVISVIRRCIQPS